jgi:hypothetical protein
VVRSRQSFCAGCSGPSPSPGQRGG